MNVWCREYCPLLTEDHTPSVTPTLPPHVVYTTKFTTHAHILLFSQSAQMISPPCHISFLFSFTLNCWSKVIQYSFVWKERKWGREDLFARWDDIWILRAKWLHKVKTHKARGNFFLHCFQEKKLNNISSADSGFCTTSLKINRSPSFFLFCFT